MHNLRLSSALKKSLITLTLEQTFEAFYDVTITTTSWLQNASNQQNSAACHTFVQFAVKDIVQ